jgi:hypothetical protein
MTITADFFKGYENTEDPEMDFRRREREKVSFYRSGAIKAVYLNEQIRIETWYGEISAELITFYEDSSIKRIFPRYGKIGAYWTEKNEAEITEYSELEVGGVVYRCRPQCLYFYPDGKLKSITIYNSDILTVKTKYGEIRTNIGVSFYRSGKIRSIEPAFKTEIEYKGKKIRPFNFFADGMHADNNSLVLDEEGYILSYI